MRPVKGPWVESCAVNDPKDTDRFLDGGVDLSSPFIEGGGFSAARGVNFFNFFLGIGMGKEGRPWHAHTHVTRGSHALAQSG